MAVDTYIRSALAFAAYYAGYLQNAATLDWLHQIGAMVAIAIALLLAVGTLGSAVNTAPPTPRRSRQSRRLRKRKAFVITETELRLMAAPAITGLSRIPNQG